MAPLICDELVDRCVTCLPEFRAEDFRGAWATPNVIRWEWTPTGDPSSFLRYELELAPTPDQLGTDAARIIDGTENPELGVYELARTENPGDVVVASHSYEHTPGTTYAGRLLVTDRNLCTFRSEFDVITTAIEPTERIVLYDGPRPDPGNEVPLGELVIVDTADGPVSEHVPSRDPECVSSGETICSQNIGWRDLDVSASRISAGSFANPVSGAFLEMELTNDTDTPTYYARIRLRLGSASTYHSFAPITVPNGTRPRVHQLPLRVLSDGSPLTHQDLQDELITAVGAGGQWSRCAPGESPPCFGGRVLMGRTSIRY